MSFYEMMRGRWPELSETEVAVKLGIPVPTFRSHRTSTPTVQTLIRIAQHLDEDPVSLLAEVVKNEGGCDAQS